MKKGTLVVYTGNDMAIRQMIAEVEGEYPNSELNASFIRAVPSHHLYAAFNSNLIPLERVQDAER